MARQAFVLAILTLLSVACSTRNPASTPVADTQTEPAQRAVVAVTKASPNPPAHLTDHTRDWQTDWSQHAVRLEELVPGGPPRDGIPPIDHPKFIDTEEAASVLAPEEPVVLFHRAQVARAYPLSILIWHEIVNDEIDGQPVTITYCPLCNTAIAFDGTVNGKRLDFGTSGLLRHSDLVMWDRQTESLWQQVTGEAIVGEMVGQRLQFLPTSILSFEAFRESYPQGEVLSSQTGHRRAYGTNPYQGYDQSTKPFLFQGELDSRLPALERVLGVVVNQSAVAYPFEALARLRVVNDQIGGRPVALFFEPATLSPLDSVTIRESRTVGSAVAYNPVVEGQRLRFEWRGDAIVDTESGSRWDITGRAIHGPMVGTQLETIPHANHFWFAIRAFYPEVEIRPGKEE